MLPEQLEWLRGELDTAPGLVTLFLHYPCSRWRMTGSEHMVITNGER
jgi:hypothetical protein